MEGFRLYIYVMMFCLWNVWEAYDRYNQRYSQGLDIEILQKSFDIENGIAKMVANLGLGDEEGDDKLEIVFSQS